MASRQHHTPPATIDDASELEAELDREDADEKEDPPEPDVDADDGGDSDEAEDGRGDDDEPSSGMIAADADAAGCSALASGELGAAEDDADDEASPEDGDELDGYAGGEETELLLLTTSLRQASLQRSIVSAGVGPKAGGYQRMPPDSLQASTVTRCSSRSPKADSSPTPQFSRCGTQQKPIPLPESPPLMSPDDCPGSEPDPALTATSVTASERPATATIPA
jgi:hypothetical protein